MKYSSRYQQSIMIEAQNVPNHPKKVQANTNEIRSPFKIDQMQRKLI